MSSKIVIVDYGMGNLHSVNKAIAVVGGDPIISSDAAVIAQAGTDTAEIFAQRQTVFRYLSGNAGFV